MEEIANNIFIENSYQGIVLAVLKLKRGLVMVDAPFRFEDQQSWRASLVNLGDSSDKLLVMLDTHIDRTMGIRGMQYNVLSHENAVEIMQNRSTTARGQDIDAGADWKPCDLPISIRWAVPNITYSKKVSIYWDDEPITLTHQPGAHLAGSWLRYEAEKVIFVGDSVVLNQPPFIAWSDLDHWLAELTWLGSNAFEGYKIVSSRNGLVRSKSIEKMINFLMRVKEVVDDLDVNEILVKQIVSAVPSLLQKLSFNRNLTELYKNRLIWGMEQYIRRHYPEENKTLKEEEV